MYNEGISLDLCVYNGGFDFNLCRGGVLYLCVYNGGFYLNLCRGGVLYLCVCTMEGSISICVGEGFYICVCVQWRGSILVPVQWSRLAGVLSWCVYNGGYIY